MVVDILKLCIDKGFLLDKTVLRLLNKLEEKKAIEIVKILTNLGLDERVVTKDLFDLHIDKFRDMLVKEGNGEAVDDRKSVKLLSASVFSSRKIEVSHFIEYFSSRYKILKGILELKNFNNLSSIRRIGSNSGIYTIIGMVFSKRITKNKNLLIEVEDLTGSSIILVNKENRVLFEKCSNLLLDDVVAFCVSGSSDMLFAKDVIYPDCELGKEKRGRVDEYVAFSGDFHVGSKMFLESNFLKFVSWLNGEMGDDRSRAIAQKVKYLFLSGDIIDGVGIYQEQEKFLNIKTCKGQYQKVAEMLGKIRGDVEIVMCPGQHDAVWIGEPQPTIPKKWASDLWRMENLYLVPNPALVEIDSNFKILMYHGASINRFIDEISEIRMRFGHSHPTKVVREMLKRRHLAPTHGIMDYIPCEGKDSLVIDVVPDIVVTGDQHRAEVGSYNNILMVAGSCWQSTTPFEEKIGNVSEPCRVPLFNLKTREIKMIDFSDDEVGDFKEVGDA
ncbi:MAG: metallophosphoesterase [Nanoarchaeota archaeon]|nr:metallophosphoesterase [Nanoarchaeota archaeon]